MFLAQDGNSQEGVGFKAGLHTSGLLAKRKIDNNKIKVSNLAWSLKGDKLACWIGGVG